MKINGMSESEFLEYLKASAARGTQVEFARRLEVSEPMVSDVLAGRRNLGPEPLAKLGFRKVSVYVEIE